MNKASMTGKRLGLNSKKKRTQSIRLGENSYSTIDTNTKL